MGYLLTFLCSLSNVCFCPYLLATIKTTGLPVIVLPLQRHFFWGGGGSASVSPLSFQPYREQAEDSTCRLKYTPAL